MILGGFHRDVAMQRRSGGGVKIQALRVKSKIGSYLPTTSIPRTPSTLAPNWSRNGANGREFASIGSWTPGEMASEWIKTRRTDAEPPLAETEPAAWVSKSSAGRRLNISEATK